VGNDCQSRNLERFLPDGTFLGAWSFPAGFFGPPNGLGLDGAGNVFVTDYDHGRVMKCTNAGALMVTIGSLLQPDDLAVDGSGNVYVLELGGMRARKFTNAGTFVATIGTAGTGPGQIQEPAGIALDASGRIYVADAARLRILRFLADGSFDMEFVTPYPPSDMAVGPDGLIYVITSEAGSVCQYSQDGSNLQCFYSPSGLNLAWRIAISSAGTIYIGEQNSNRVTKFQIDQATAASRVSLGRVKAMYR
jgi:DNA-binding beta-propeller fold protein YncE